MSGPGALIFGMSLFCIPVDILIKIPQFQPLRGSLRLGCSFLGVRPNQPKGLFMFGGGGEVRIPLASLT